VIVLFWSCLYHFQDTLPAVCPKTNYDNLAAPTGPTPTTLNKEAQGNLNKTPNLSFNTPT